MPDSSHITSMPSLRGRNSLKFKGKNVEEFLVEFEYYAEHVKLTNAQKCKEVRMYFATCKKRVLDVLDGYKNVLWFQLKTELQSLYTSSDEKKHYRPKDIQKFISKECKILKLAHFDDYRREFLVIARNLESQNALSEYDRDDYFWSALKLASFRNSLEKELKTKELWTDLTVPPPMRQVLTVAQDRLKNDLYQVRDFAWVKSKTASKKAKEEESDDGSETESDNGSDSSESSDEASSEGEEWRSPRKKVDLKKSKRAINVKKDESIESPTVDTAVKPDSGTQLNIDDLTERFKQLEMKLAEKSAPRTKIEPHLDSRSCFMCG